AGLSDNGFSELELFDADAVVHLPEALDALDVPGEPLGCVMNVMRRAEVRPGQSVAIVGIGFLGAALVPLAADDGARVIAISRREHALRVARDMGARHTFTMDTPDLEAKVQEITGGGCDVVIEVVGMQEPLDVASKLTRERGRLVIAGFHQ